MTLGVFFPSLMGIGILVSGALLLSDQIRRILPQGGLHRRHRVAMGAFGVVSRAAEWAELDIAAGELFDRVPRHPLTYGAWAIAGMAAAVGVPIAATAAYADEAGLFFHSPWMVGLGVAAAIGFGLLALLVILTLVFGRRRSGPFLWLVARTSLGRLQVPDIDAEGAS